MSEECAAKLLDTTPKQIKSESVDYESATD